MAVTCTLLTSGTAVSQTTPLTIPAVVIPNGKFAMLFVGSVVASGSPNSMGLANSTGFTNKSAWGNFTNGTIEQFTVQMVGTGVSATLVVSWTAMTMLRVTWHLVYFDGVNIANPSGGPAPNGKLPTGTGTTASATMSAFQSTNNATFFCAVSASNTTHSAEAGWTELDEQGGSTTGTLRSSCDFLASNDLSPSATVGNAAWVAAAVEIAAGTTSTSATAGNAAGTGTASGEGVTGSTHPFVAAGTGSASTETVLREALPLAGAAGGTGVAGLGASYVDVHAECPTGLGECVDPGISSTGGVGEVLDDPTFSNPSTTQVSMLFSPTPTAGDLLLAVIGWNTVNRTVTSGSGWTKIGADHLNGTVTTYDCALSFWWKRSLGTESGAQLWNASGAAMLMDGQMARYAALADPVDQSAESSDALSFTKTTLASGTTGTTTVANELLLSGFMLAAVKTLSFSNSFLELATVDRLHVATRNVTATGAYSTTGTWTGTTDGTAAIITVSGQTSKSVTAGNAAGTGSGFAAKTTSSTTALVAAGTGVAAQQVASLRPNAGAVTGTGLASPAVDKINPNAANAPATGLASPAVTFSGPTSGTAAGIGTANPPAVTFVYGPTGLASGTGQAANPSISSTSSISAAALVALGVGTSNQTTTINTSGAHPTVASGTGLAGLPPLAIEFAPIAAASTGIAFDAIVFAANQVPPTATGTGTAGDPSISIESDLPVDSTARGRALALTR